MIGGKHCEETQGEDATYKPRTETSNGPSFRAHGRNQPADASILDFQPPEPRRHMSLVRPPVVQQPSRVSVPVFPTALKFLVVTASYRVPWPLTELPAQRLHRSFLDSHNPTGLAALVPQCKRELTDPKYGFFAYNLEPVRISFPVGQDATTVSRLQHL